LAESGSSGNVEIPLVWSERIDARFYQQSIAEKACERNTLVVMPTALGKTIISALVAAYFLYKQRQMRVLIMAPTRPLVLQHHETYSNILKLSNEDMIVLTGKTPSAYRKHVWDGKARIIFATPQIVRNDLESGILSLKDFSLLVFDECHRARKDYAYTDVAKKYVEQAQWPIILGMTASPGADKEKILDICSALFIEQIEYRSEEDTDVLPYIHPVKVEWAQVDLPSEYREMSRTIRIMLNERLDLLSRRGILHTRPEYANRRDLLEAGEHLRHQLLSTIEEWKGPIFNAIVVQSASLTLFHALELLETQGLGTLLSFLEKVDKQGETKRSYKTIISDPHYLELKRLLDRNKSLDHPKIPVMKTLIQNQFRETPNSKVLVFTQYRDTASHLVERLRDIDGLVIERFVGQASKEEDVGLSQEEQARIISDFRDGDTNVLVATSIAEEGLDIPSVDLVIFYEPIPSEIRYIQRKGRTGRRTAGKAMILAANDTYDIAYLHASRRRVERMRKMIASLNLELKPFTRNGPKPEPNPIAKEELLNIERHVEISHLDLRSTDSEMKANQFLKQVDKASRYIWKKVLKTDVEGLAISYLIEEAEKEGTAPAVAEAAIDNLQEAGQLAKIGTDRVATVASIPARDFPRTDEDTYDLLVEDIRPGMAIVLVDGKWRVRLVHVDFEGPVNLLKKNSRFKVRGAFYHNENVLHFRVREVVQQFS